MSIDGLQSDLVRDSKIQTEFLETCTQHIFYETGRSARERWVMRLERWVREDLLGRGSFGSVYLERCEYGNSGLRAVKEIKKTFALDEELDYTQELKAIAKFSHPKYKLCFVHSGGWFENQDSVFISMEYFELGDLQRHLTQPFPEDEARQITSQVLEGLRFMHENDFIHRDLKPANIMVVSKGPEWFVKLADFGISKRHKHPIVEQSRRFGTRGFAAPEILEYDDSNSYTAAVDMWSLGALVYRMLTNTVAFHGIWDLGEYINGAMLLPQAELVSNNVSKAGIHFIAKLMHPKPECRPSVESATTHPWITRLFLDRIVDPLADVADPTRISTTSKAWSTQTESTQLSNQTDTPIATPTDVTPELPTLRAYKPIEATPDLSDSDSTHTQSSYSTAKESTPVTITAHVPKGKRSQSSLLKKYFKSSRQSSNSNGEHRLSLRARLTSSKKSKKRKEGVQVTETNGSRHQQIAPSLANDTNNAVEDGNDITSHTSTTQGSTVSGDYTDVDIDPSRRRLRRATSLIPSRPSQVNVSEISAVPLKRRLRTGSDSGNGVVELRGSSESSGEKGGSTVGEVEIHSRRNQRRTTISEGLKKYFDSEPPVKGWLQTPI